MREMEISVSLQFPTENCPFPLNFHAKTMGKFRYFLLWLVSRSQVFFFLQFRPHRFSQSVLHCSIFYFANPVFGRPKAYNFSPIFNFFLNFSSIFKMSSILQLPSVAVSALGVSINVNSEFYLPHDTIPGLRGAGVLPPVPG